MERTRHVCRFLEKGIPSRNSRDFFRQNFHFTRFRILKQGFLFGSLQKDQLLFLFIDGKGIRARRRSLHGNQNSLCTKCLDRQAPLQANKPPQRFIQLFFDQELRYHFLDRGQFSGAFYLQIINRNFSSHVRNFFQIQRHSLCGCLSCQFNTPFV